MGLFDWLKKTEEADGISRADSEDGDAAQIESQLPRSEMSERFLDEGQIAKGGMGVIRRVFNRNLLRREAMKVLDAGVAEDENELLRFLEEAQITGQLDHPNIPPVHEVGENANGLHFFTMKMVRGQTLEQLLVSPKFSVADDQRLFEVLQVLDKVCDAIAFAHSRGVIHCDLKPPNVMIGKFGQVYVMDWGIARMKGVKRKRRTDTGADLVHTIGRDAASDEGRVMGTLGYMPPEQAHGWVDKIDERTDVFALGALLYRILTGRAPHVGASPEETWELAKACQVTEPQEMVDAQDKDLHLPPRLCKMAMKALEADMTLRFANVSEFQTELEEFLRGAGRYPTQDYAQGELVIREGDTGDSAYVILKGKARVFRVEHGQSKTLRTMGPGEVFGETAILTDHPRSASVEAAEPLTVVVVARDALEREMGQTFWVGHILKALAERFRDLDARMHAEQDDTAGRLEDAVVRYLAFQGKTAPDGTRSVGWTALRRHLRQLLKLGDIQVMALCAGVRGLRVSESADEAVLTQDASPGGLRPSGASLPITPVAPPSRPGNETLRGIAPLSFEPGHRPVTGTPTISEESSARPKSGALPGFSTAPTPRAKSGSNPAAQTVLGGEVPVFSSPPTPRAKSGSNPAAQTVYTGEPPELSSAPTPRAKSGATPAVPTEPMGVEPVAFAPTPRAKSGANPAVQMQPVFEPLSSAPTPRAKSESMPALPPPDVEPALSSTPTPKLKSGSMPALPPPDVEPALSSTPTPRVKSGSMPAVPDPAARPRSQALPAVGARPKSVAVPSVPPPPPKMVEDHATVSDVPPEFAATEMMPEGMDIDALIEAASKIKAGQGGGDGDKG